MEWLTTIFRSFSKIFQWWVVVAPWERALRVRLGKIAADLAPGIHFRIPFLDRILLQSIRLRTVWDSAHTVSSRDGHTLTVGVAIDFAIVDLRLMFESLSSPEVTLRYRAASAITRFASQNDRNLITSQAVESAINSELASFGCGLGEIRARLTGFAFAKAYRLLINDYSSGAGLQHGFDLDQPTNK